MDKTPHQGKFERGGFVLFLALVSLALIAIAWPFASALLWAMLASIMFQPLNQWMLLRCKGRASRAAIFTLCVIIIAVIIPALIIGSLVADQVVGVYLGISDRKIDLSELFLQVHDALPEHIQSLVDKAGFGDIENLSAKLAGLIGASAGFLARHVLAFGGSALSWALSFGVGIYVTFYLLRDGLSFGSTITRTLPLPSDIATKLTGNFTRSVRATIKGSVVVGLVQGALGAITFWIVGLPSVLLFGVLMAIFSLLPAVGPSIVWLPVAVYLFATGAIWEGLVVVASGIFVIGLADNLLRPILVGRDTGLPDWLVLVTTLGGISMFGLAGIVMGPVVAGLFLTGWAVMTRDPEPTPPPPPPEAS